MDLLFILASRPNEVFSREALTRELWPHTTVGEDALARCVFKLRRALEDNEAGSPRVETIPKRGYRLLPGAERAPGTARRMEPDPTR
ncbi:MAG: winged helix-turn-helix domain-containing protein, partial [Phenylobacterium sp.]